MSSYADLSRPPLDGRRITQALQRTSELWRELHVLARTGSTNTDLAARAAAGETEGFVLAAEEQDAGRGRLDRVWSAPARSALTFSVLLRPPVPPSAFPLLPLLAGVAIVDALADRYAVGAALKWPNDVMARDRKLAGILAETVGDAVIIGIGLNVLQKTGELAVESAVSLVALTDEPVDRSIVLLAVLRAFEGRYAAWLEADAEPEVLLAAYRQHCSTIGQHVRVELAGERRDGETLAGKTLTGKTLTGETLTGETLTGETLTGTATGVDERGHLVVDTADGPRHIAAGDVIHVRRA